MSLDAGAGPVYDRIGRGYTATRSPDPRIAAAIVAALGEARSVVNLGAGSGVPIPHDCRDGFLGAFWRRPAAYLDPRVRAGMSGFAQLPAGTADHGLARLADDLRSGVWQARFGALRGQESADLGYRLVVGFPGPRASGA